MKCKYYDCGWCYHTRAAATNATNGQCNNPTKCPQYIGQADEYNIESSIEVSKVSPLDATANASDEWPDEYEQSQHSAAEVTQESSETETVKITPTLRIAINETMASINSQNDPQITGQLRWHLEKLLEYERNTFKGGES